jgi:hypothetical protein
MNEKHMIPSDDEEDVINALATGFMVTGNEKK